MIEATGLSHRFTRPSGDHHVLNGIHLGARAGEIVGIVGPSGCGKTTLLRIMAGLLVPSAGTVMLQGVPVREPGQGAVLIFQEYGKSLFPWKTVAENVRTGAHGRSLPDRELDDVLRLVQLHDCRDRFPRELSGGMQQRVVMARAFVRKPRVMLMDEPFGSLDGLTRYGLQAELLRWARPLEMAIVIVTHDLDEASFLCNRVVVLSPRPATVLAQFAVELPEPRDPVTTRRTPEYVEVRTALQQRLAGTTASPPHA